MKIEANSAVSMHYCLSLDNQQMIDSSFDREPLNFVMGSGAIIEGLEKALVGKAPGDSFNVTVKPKHAYGEYEDSFRQTVPKAAFEVENEIQPGMQFQSDEDGGVRVYTVVNVEGDTITVDGNHPLAGQALNFDIQVLKHRQASEEEKISGIVKSL